MENEKKNKPVPNEETENAFDLNEETTENEADVLDETTENTENSSETTEESDLTEDTGENAVALPETATSAVDKKPVSKKKKTIIIVVICVLVALLVAGGVLFYNNYYVTEQKYESAVSLYNDKKYDDAKKTFETVSDFKDSKEYIKKCDNNINLDKNYDSAMALFNKEKYTDALNLFQKCGNYKETQKYISESKRLNALLTKYNEALKLEVESEYDSAADAFKELKDYKDSKNRVEECKNEKKNWGKMKKKSFDLVETPEYEMYYVYSFEKVKNATGFQVYATGYADRHALTGDKLSFKENKSSFIFGSGEDVDEHITVRAYHKCKNGDTLYGDWYSCKNNGLRVRNCSKEELAKLRNDSIDVSRCSQSIDYESYYAEEDRKNGIGNDRSVTKYSNINGLVFTMTKHPMNSNGSLRGVGRKFGSATSDLLAFYKINDHSIKRYGFTIVRSDYSSTYIVDTIDGNDKYALADIKSPTNGIYYVYVYDDETGEMLDYAEAYVGYQCWPLEAE